MKQTVDSIAAVTLRALTAAGHAAIADHAAQRCAWLEACGYPGISQLQDALADVETDAILEKDALGLDLKGVSCVFIATKVEGLVRTHGRLFLRNVRHGLYLLPGSVTDNYGIGCPVDPGFPLGGERGKNPYVEKLEMAARDGIEVDVALWQSLSE